MKHHFDVAIATKYGMVEAVLLENLFYWVKKNSANDRHFYDGKYWTYNSRKAFARLFPYIGEKSIERSLNHLVEIGILLKGNYNEDKFDKTSWFAFTEYGELVMSDSVEFSDTDNLSTSTGQFVQSMGQNVQSNNNNYTDSKQTDNKPKRTKEGTNSSYESILESSDLDESVKPVVWEFIKMRKFIKSPMTDTALSLMINKLKKMDSSPEGQIEILNQSISNSWKGLFPLKEDGRKNQGNGRNDHIFEMIDRLGLGDD